MIIKTVLPTKSDHSRSENCFHDSKFIQDRQIDRAALAGMLPNVGGPKSKKRQL